jgi:hypothetical protein
MKFTLPKISTLTLLRRPLLRRLLPSEAAVQGYSVGMDFTVNTAHMYGLPQRADNFRLEDTGFDHPYRLFN